MSLTWIAIAAILTYSFIKTISYGTWTWKQKNVLGSLMLYLLAAISVALPVYALISRR